MVERYSFTFTQYTYVRTQKRRGTPMCIVRKNRHKKVIVTVIILAMVICIINTSLSSVSVSEKIADIFILFSLGILVLVGSGMMQKK